MATANFAMEVNKLHSSSRQSSDDIRKNYDLSSLQNESSFSMPIDDDMKTNPVQLTWENISVAVPERKAWFSSKVYPRKQILSNISGHADPGTLTAIMGASGEGKTTLLNALTKRNVAGLKITGEILTNGVKIGNNISCVSSYVQQSDLFMGELTVKEHLIFTAQLRMDPSCTAEQRSNRVKTVMHQMGLQKCENTRIGTPGITKGISGGEKKRLNVASELLTKPSILFLDEPTSGLDSSFARIVVEHIKKVALEGCTVLCTIHQPSSETFSYFDRLLLLGTGQTVYHGSIEGASKFYQSCGYPCPLNYNPADHFVESVSIATGMEQESRQIVSGFVKNYQSSVYHENALQAIQEAKEYKKKDNTVKDVIANADFDYKTGFTDQLSAFFSRAIKIAWRNPISTYVKFFQSAFITILVGLVYLRTPYGSLVDKSQIGGVVGGLIFIIINTSFISVLSVLNTFPREIPVFRREHFNKMYSTLVFFISKNLAELPHHVIDATIYATLSYFMLGLLPDLKHFFIFFGLMVLMLNTCVSLGYLISSASSNVTVALGLGPGIMMCLLILSGFFGPSKTAPGYLQWVRKLSWFYPMNELFNLNQWTDLGEITGCRTITIDPIGPVGPIEKPVPWCIDSGEKVNNIFNLEEDNYYWDIGMVCCLLIVYRTLSLLMLYIRVRPSQR